MGKKAESEHRKKIRKINTTILLCKTRRTAKEEVLRKKRLAERRTLFDELFKIPESSEESLTKLILDFNPQTKEELIKVHPDLVNKLKLHQAKGVKFMWDSCFESIEQIKVNKEVGGCILAHCMGLGKTFQVITLVHTVLRYKETKVKTVLIICPLSTVLNWVHEFEYWLGNVDDDADIHMFHLTECKNNMLRVDCLKRWKKKGGVMIVGYEMFRNLVTTKKEKPEETVKKRIDEAQKKLEEDVKKRIDEALLNPGPDLVVCDEGHVLKNELSAISKATKKIRTLRRIVLTGTPLQNNLIEYHCMVQFVKPNLLGDKKAFSNRFVHPITNGQYIDSTKKGVRIMKRRSHILHKLLGGFVQRFDYNVLTPFLPPKQEFVISVALSDLQAVMYEHYIEKHSWNAVGSPHCLFKDYQIMRLIWTHPHVMKLRELRTKKITAIAGSKSNSSKDFIVSESEDENSSSCYCSDDSDGESVISVGGIKSDKQQHGNMTKNSRKDSDIEVDEVKDTPDDTWWHKFVTEDDIEDYKQGPKLVLLFAILKECERIGDKILIFSQSIFSLDMIEHFLQKTNEFSQHISTKKLVGNENLSKTDYLGTWTKNIDYFRLDGQTPQELRTQYCNIFNRSENDRSRLFLISTKAGGMGINLTSANRVIIFDVSWNPSQDVQSIFRVYRFGQDKPCYIYRFVAQGTMEEKIYERQVTKLSVSCRVVDEQQIDRHFSHNELEELYTFTRKMYSEEETPKLPNDHLMAELLKEYKDIILSYHEHDSLLQNVIDEELTEEEKKHAWKEYEYEKNVEQNLWAPILAQLHKLKNQLLGNPLPSPQQHKVQVDPAHRWLQNWEHQVPSAHSWPQNWKNQAPVDLVSSEQNNWEHQVPVDLSPCQIQNCQYQLPVDLSSIELHNWDHQMPNDLAPSRLQSRTREMPVNTASSELQNYEHHLVPVDPIPCQLQNWEYQLPIDLASVELQNWEDQLLIDPASTKLQNWEHQMLFDLASSQLRSLTHKMPVNPVPIQQQVYEYQEHQVPFDTAPIQPQNWTQQMPADFSTTSMSQFHSLWPS